MTLGCTPITMPMIKPSSPTKALTPPSPPQTDHHPEGAVKNTSAPIITNPPKTNRVAGEKPAFARNSFVATDMYTISSTLI